jgi:hypothetical protein
MRKILVIDPVPDGDWSIEFSGTKMTYRGISVASIRVEDREESR